MNEPLCGRLLRYSLEGIGEQIADHDLELQAIGEQGTVGHGGQSKVDACSFSTPGEQCDR